MLFASAIIVFIGALAWSQMLFSSALLADFIVQKDFGEVGLGASMLRMLRTAGCCHNSITNTHVRPLRQVSFPFPRPAPAPQPQPLPQLRPPRQGRRRTRWLRRPRCVPAVLIGSDPCPGCSVTQYQPSCRCWTDRRRRRGCVGCSVCKPRAEVVGVVGPPAHCASCVLPMPHPAPWLMRGHAGPTGRWLVGCCRGCECAAWRAA